MPRIVLYMSFVIISGLMIFTCFGCVNSNRDKKMMQQGAEVILKVEAYKNKHNKLPNSLSDLELQELDGIDVIYYYKRDDIH